MVSARTWTLFLAGALNYDISNPQSLPRARPVRGAQSYRLGKIWETAPFRFFSWVVFPFHSGNPVLPSTAIRLWIEEKTPPGFSQCFPHLNPPGKKALPGYSKERRNQMSWSCVFQQHQYSFIWALDTVLQLKGGALQMQFLAIPSSNQIRALNLSFI